MQCAGQLHCRRTPVAAIAPLPPWSQHPTLKSLQPSRKIIANCRALLGDAQAPDRWHYRSLQLLAAGEAITGMQRAHHPVCADPKTTPDMAL
jgi:hypothetical protein